MNPRSTTGAFGRCLAAFALTGAVALAGCSGQGGTTSPAASGSSAGPHSAASTSPSASAASPTAASATPTAVDKRGGTAASGSAQPSEGTSAAAPATTPVAAPGGGSINEKVSAKAVATPSPQPVGATVAPAQGVAVSIGTKPTTLTAKVPGDISGKGVLVNVTIKNTGASAVPVGETVVNLTGADGTPGSNFEGDPAKPFTGNLAPGASATGTYAFRLEPQQYGQVRIEVRGNPAVGIAVYQGTVKA